MVKNGYQDTCFLKHYPQDKDDTACLESTYSKYIYLLVDDWMHGDELTEFLTLWLNGTNDEFVIQHFTSDELRDFANWLLARAHEYDTIRKKSEDG